MAHHAHNPKSLRIFYDGACPLCSREIHHYERLKGGEKLTYIDIAAADFDAREFGLDPKAVQRELHVLTDEGAVLTGVDAFGAIWAHLPRYRLLVPLTTTPGVRQAMQMGYAAFARLRPYLPGRKNCGQKGKDSHACSVGAAKSR